MESNVYCTSPILLTFNNLPFFYKNPVLHSVMISSLQSTILWITLHCNIAVDVLSLVWCVRPQWVFYILIAVHLPSSFPTLCPKHKCVHSCCFCDYIQSSCNSLSWHYPTADKTVTMGKWHDHVLWEVGLGSLPGGTVARAWSWPLLYNQCQVKEMWRYASTPTTCLHSIHKDNFTFYHPNHYLRSLSTTTASFFTPPNKKTYEGDLHIAVFKLL
jgi:hypothetical protein